MAESARELIAPDPAPPWEWLRELDEDGAAPRTKAELFRPYVPRRGAVDVMADRYGDPILDGPDDF